MTEWISNPLTFYALSGIGLLGSFGLWIASRLEAGSVRNELSDSRKAMETQVQEMTVSLNQLRSDLDREPVTPAPAFAEALNLTLRSRIVRMHRRGETEAGIAAALRVPCNQIELVLKMDRLLNAAGVSESLETET